VSETAKIRLQGCTTLRVDGLDGSSADAKPQVSSYTDLLIKSQKKVKPDLILNRP
jgi:hypothetical protein